LNSIMATQSGARFCRDLAMASNTVIRDAYGTPAVFAGSKTGSDDAPFVFIRVGDEERRMRWTEWDALPPWTGPVPAWAKKKPGPSL
jgi:hypothetical protein